MANYLAIFRVPPEDEDHLFVEVEVNDGVVAGNGRFFSIDNPEDTYCLLDYHQVVIAEPCEGGSRDLGVFDLVDTESEQKIAVCGLEGIDLMVSIAGLVQVYEESLEA